MSDWILLTHFVCNKNMHELSMCVRVKAELLGREGLNESLHNEIKFSYKKEIRF